MEKLLEKIGFSRSEAKVYLALLDVGPTTAGEIIKACGLHRNIVYECMDKLKDRKLASVTFKKGKKFFTPLDPKIILAQEKKKMEITEKIMPQLAAKLKNDRQQIIVYEGLDEHRDLQIKKIEEMSKGGNFYVICPAGVFYNTMGKEKLKEYEELRISKKVKLKIIFYKEQFKKESAYTKTRKYVESRVIKENLETPAYTTVWQDSIIICLLGEPVTNIEIKNKDIVKAYVNYFNFLWRLGKTG